ncbi:MAG: hypothetical protein OWT28_02170 [Firmicutes bacterium]|nr:hypothetical protein [Bacillota bacterium]
MDESIVHAVISQYPFRVYEWRWLASDYCRLETDAGRKMLRIERDATAVVWRGELLDALAAQRFRRTPRLLRTVYGDSVVTVRDVACTVTDDWAYRSVSHEAAELVVATENLGDLHAAMNRLARVSHLQPQGRQGTPSLIQRLQEAKQILQATAARSEETPFGQVFRAHARDVLLRAARAETTFREAGGLARDQQRDCRHLTLGGYHPGMVAWTDLGHLATIDFDHVIWGDPEWDLYAFGRWLYEQGEVQSLTDLVQRYEQRLGSADPDRLQRLVGFVGFPFAIARVAAEYVNSKDKADPAHVQALTRAFERDFSTARKEPS